MYVTLARAEDQHATIVRFRREICQILRLPPESALVDPLPFATYLFGYTDDGPDPAGMVELYFYDQAYTDYAAAVYNQAADLGQIAPMHQLAHVRSVAITPAWQRSRLFLHLCTAMALVAHRMGGRFLTMATGVNNDAILALHRRAGARPLGIFRVSGAEQHLSLLDLEPVIRRVARRWQTDTLRVDPAVMGDLRARRREGASPVLPRWSSPAAD